MSKLTSFVIDNKSVSVDFVETQTVKEGVTCDLYTFNNDSTKDLAIVTVSKGYKTPLQLILSGDKTVEGFMEGVGTLTVKNKDGKAKIYSFDKNSHSKEVFAEVGETMQWYAKDTDLVFYEVCYPPYEDGRFENLPESDAR